MGSALRRSTDIRMVLAASASAGAAMIVVETYWQLAFEGLSGGATWALGPVNCAGMGAAAAGSAVAMRWASALSRRTGGRRRLYLALQAAVAACVAIFSLAGSVGAFLVVYLAFYLLLGVRSVVEQTVLHAVAPSSGRSGMASMQSIALRGGGFAAGAAAGPLVSLLTLAGAWPALAALSAVPALPALVPSPVRTSPRA